MHTSHWILILVALIFWFLLLFGVFRLRGGDIIIRCTSCNRPVVLPWEEGAQNFDLAPLIPWGFTRDLGWRCPECGDGPPQRWPKIFLEHGAAPHDDIH